MKLFHLAPIKLPLELVNPWKIQLLPFQFTHFFTLMSVCMLDCCCCFFSPQQEYSCCIIFCGLLNFIQTCFKGKVPSATLLWAFSLSGQPWSREECFGRDMKHLYEKHGQITAGKLHEILLLTSCKLYLGLLTACRDSLTVCAQPVNKDGVTH